MPTLSLSTPDDYALARDCCSYGYFLLAPNRWNVREQSLTRPLRLRDASVVVEITQPKGHGTPLRVRTSRMLAKDEKAEARAQIGRMLRLDEDAGVIDAFHARDPRWKPSGRGRLFRSPTLFEDVIKTVTSCNVTWPGTVQMNLRLCEVLGAKEADTRGFPDAAKMARTRPQTLRARCRVGYRDQRLVEMAKRFRATPARGGLDVVWLEDPRTSDEDVRETLLDLPGIGPYAAANIMQLMGRYAHVPCDTETVRHAKLVLGYKGTSAAVTRRVRTHYAPFGPHAFRSYWFELWDYYESKHGPAHTWERDSTGKLFTAALLNKQE
ncbi:MAG: hypothetical protein IPM33_09570 [Phycisphaerales bacterium]|nr:hypothetical protein [Phycisphaerales bacterium]